MGQELVLGQTARRVCPVVLRGPTRGHPHASFDLVRFRRSVFGEESACVYVDVVWTRARDMFTPARFRKEGMYSTRQILRASIRLPEAASLGSQRLFGTHMVRISLSPLFLWFLRCCLTPRSSKHRAIRREETRFLMVSRNSF